MKTVLVTGFTPFGKETINPAYESVRLLPDEIEGAKIVKLEVPTSFERGPKMVIEAIDQLHPDLILCVGQAGGRAKLSFEFVGLNYIHARIADNDGKQPDHISVCPGAPDAYFTNIPVYEVVNHLNEQKIPAHVSYSEGTYVCNALFYSVMEYIHRKNLSCMMDFVHVPFILEQTIDKGNDMPSMSLRAMEMGLHCAIKYLLKM